MHCLKIPKHRESEPAETYTRSPIKPRTPTAEPRLLSTRKYGRSDSLLQRTKTPSSYPSSPCSTMSASTTPRWSSSPRDPAMGRARITHVGAKGQNSTVMQRLAGIDNLKLVVCFQQELLEGIVPGCQSDGHILRADQQCKATTCACRVGCKGTSCPICWRDVKLSRQGINFVEYSPGVLIHKVYGDDE